MITFLFNLVESNSFDVNDENEDPNALSGLKILFYSTKLFFSLLLDSSLYKNIRSLFDGMRKENDIKLNEISKKIDRKFRADIVSYVPLFTYMYR